MERPTETSKSTTTLSGILNCKSVLLYARLTNEFMAKDTSRKIKGAFRAKFLNGERVNSMAPFGCQKHPDIKNKLMIDEETAWIVRKIFDLAYHGMGFKRIAGVLMDEKIPCPGWFQYTRNGGCARFLKVSRTKSGICGPRHISLKEPMKQSLRQRFLRQCRSRSPTAAGNARIRGHRFCWPFDVRRLWMGNALRHPEQC